MYAPLALPLQRDQQKWHTLECTLRYTLLILKIIPLHILYEKMSTHLKQIPFYMQFSWSRKNAYAYEVCITVKSSCK